MKNTNKQVYYFAELTDKNSYCQADKIEARSLLGAKRIASKNKCFYGTVLEIGVSINSQGFILSRVSYKENGKWIDTY